MAMLPTDDAPVKNFAASIQLQHKSILYLLLNNKYYQKFVSALIELKSSYSTQREEY
jgi:hypothetical protein